LALLPEAFALTPGPRKPDADSSRNHCPLGRAGS